jgi:predicted phage tail protein
MPLSEQEQRLLDEMERNLYHGDSDYVATVGARTGRPSIGAIVLGVAVAAAGVGVLLAGVATRLPILGVAGFLVMFAGVVLIVAPPKRLASRRAADHPGVLHDARERWQHRSDEEH